MHLELKGRLFLLHDILIKSMTVYVIQPEIRIGIDLLPFSPRLFNFIILPLGPLASTLPLLFPSLLLGLWRLLLLLL